MEPTNPSQRPNRKRVLVVDDDINRHRVFAKHFQSLGYEVFQATKAQEAMGILQAGPRFDLAHLDHDLEDFIWGTYGERYECTGQDVARCIAAMLPDARPCRVVIHSWNPAGAKIMLETLREAGVQVEYAPYRDGTKEMERGASSCEEEWKILRFGGKP